MVIYQNGIYNYMVIAFILITTNTECALCFLDGCYQCILHSCVRTEVHTHTRTRTVTIHMFHQIVQSDLFKSIDINFILK